MIVTLHDTCCTLQKGSAMLNALNAKVAHIEKPVKKHLIERLEHDTKLAIEWLKNSYMKLHEDKCHLLVADMKLYGLTLERLEFGKARMKRYLD